MRYQGSKLKMAQVIKRLAEANLSEGQWYVEPFGGGMNSFSAVECQRKLANDVNSYTVELWNAIRDGKFTDAMWEQCLNIDESTYRNMKDDCLGGGRMYSPAVLGYVAFACSYGGGWWAGFARYNPRRNEDHVREAYGNIRRQISSFKNLRNSRFVCGSYDELAIPGRSFIYCDPPYAGTRKYAGNFDSTRFWTWAENMVNAGHKVMVSEYTAPEGWVCIWSKDMQDGMSADSTKRKKECIFVHKSQIKSFKY